MEYELTKKGRAVIQASGLRGHHGLRLKIDGIKGVWCG
jgi:hypothetical protein